MPPSSPTSFIAKQALERPSASPASRPVSLLVVIAILVLFVSGLVFGGALVYRSLLETEITASCTGGGGVERCGLRATVEREQKNIDQLTIRTLQRLDKKLSLATTLLGSHRSILSIFDLIQKNTIPSVRYSSFSYSPKAIALDGTAASFEDIAVQTGIWNEAKKQNQIESFIFSDLNQGAEDVVTFKLTLVINPSLVLVQNQSL